MLFAIAFDQVIFYSNGRYTVPAEQDDKMWDI